MEQREFENIAASLRSRVMSVARGYGLDTDSVEDVAQDTMLKLWTMRSRMDGEKQVVALAVTIAKHLAVDVLRGRKCIGLDKVAVVDSRYRQPDAQLENSENEVWLKGRFKSLPSKEYAVLHLRQVEHMSMDEIAAIVGVSENSVPTMLARARRKLLEEMKRRNR